MLGLVLSMSILWLVSLSGFFCSVLQLLCGAFQPSELQHVHIAWNMAQGLVPYRDFFEHHGLLLSYLNAFFMQCLGPAWVTLYVLRLISFVLALLLVLQTMRFAQVLFPKAKHISFYAMGFLLTTLPFIFTAYAIRPDTLQNLLWVSGLLYIYNSVGKGSRRQGFIAGLCLGAMLLANTKMLPGFLAVLLYLGVVKQWRVLLYFLLGSFCVIMPWLLYAFFHGALADYFYYTTIYNFYVLRVQSDQFFLVMPKILVYQLVQVLLMFFGLSVWRRSADVAERQAVLFLLLMILSVSFGAVLGMYAYYYMAFMPLWAILSGYGLVHLSRRSYYAVPLVFALVGLSLFVLAFQSVPYRPQQKLLQQQASLEYVLGKYQRSTPALFLWSANPAFVFNRDVDYFWHVSEHAELSYRASVGYDVFRPVGGKIIEGKVPIIVSDINTLGRVFSTAVVRNIQEKYEQIYPELWVRR